VRQCKTVGRDIVVWGDSGCRSVNEIQEIDQG
jgi:hypothetical protein